MAVRPRQLHTEGAAGELREVDGRLLTPQRRLEEQSRVAQYEVIFSLAKLADAGAFGIYRGIVPQCMPVFVKDSRFL